ncbi:GNAT family N-acetyltransferase [Hahella ganghwensis]|uniref:GNAT family N-acetyltransferase n=1 Tax=Hahella ganghwensis TaxID=286420 RepID=UPI0003639BB4|nr:GNAT family N-acetyltransferase [Hahella ganghwensis]
MTHSDVIIRAAAPTDGAALRLLMDELGYPMEHKVLQANLEQLATDPECALLVAEISEQVCGFAMAYTSKSLTAGKSAIIGHLVVTESKRGAGIGRRLVAELKDWTKRQGLTTIRVGSQTYREAAHKFYEDQGFNKIKTQLWFQQTLNE